MSGFENGRIILDEERDVFYAGQVLSGKIEFGLSQPLVFRAITVEYHGEATVEWSEIQVEEYNGVRRETTQEYGAREEYFNIVQCVCGGVGVSQLPAGSHSIPFRYQIPATAPSYFEGRDGQVSYYVKACLEFPDGREKMELEEAFEVVVPLDLNANPAMKEPIYMEFEEVVSGCCCGSGLLAVQVKLPAKGYCPGQDIPVEVTADNQSAVEISQIAFELVQRNVFHSVNPQSDKMPPSESLAKYIKGPIMARTKRNFTCHVLVPDMIAPVLDHCGIIDVRFFFKVKLKLSGCNDDLEDEEEICLGLIPITELIEGHYTHPMQSDLPKGPIPNLNAPPEFIQPYIYPSITLQNQVQPVHVQNVSNYPGSNAYPGNNYPQGTPYPGNAPFNAPYSMANPGYPGTTPPYPGANPPYPGSNPPYPGTNPYPGTKAENPPYPTNPSPFAPSPAGFTVPGMPGPGYPMGPVTGSSPYNPSAPSAP